MVNKGRKNKETNDGEAKSSFFSRVFDKLISIWMIKIKQWVQIIRAKQSRMDRFGSFVITWENKD